MKNTLLSISLLAIALLSSTGLAHGKFAEGASILRNYSTSGDSDFEFSPEATHIPAMIQVHDADIEETIAELEEQGVTVLYHRGDILLTFVPVEYYGNMRRAKGVKRFEPARPKYNKPTMDDARNFNGAFRINEGIDLPAPYDGTGVVVGVCDNGMDARHPNFLTADGSECRIRKVVQYQEEWGLREEYNTPQEIYDWETDSPDDWHATHVAGIAAGAFSANGYQSLAPGADIVFTASQLSDVGLLAGVEDIIAYAKENGQPAVINLSMGNIIGPRDGTSLFTQYLDRCADDAIICISAGNDGSMNRSMMVDFTDSNREIKVQTTNWSGMHNYGIADVWSTDHRPFLFALYLRHNVDPSQNILFETIDFSDPDISRWRISADPEDPDYNETFAKHYFRGYIEVEGGINPLNGRFNVIVGLDCETDEYSPVSNNSWALYWPGISISADPGTHVDIHCGYGDSFLRQERGYPAPGNDLSISDLATGSRTISVGMTNNKTTETKFDGTVSNTGFTAGEINVHSSYGTLHDGRVLPVTCAPGAIVVSSISSPYLSQHPEMMQHVNSVDAFNGKDYYWISNIGTSMSCPYVVSAIATWLQANPNLTADQALEIVKKTNTHDYPDPSNGRNGQGWFNAYEGLKMATSDFVTEGTEITLDGVAMDYVDGYLRINNLTGQRLAFALYSVNGMRVKMDSIDNGFTQINLAGNPSGVYIVELENPYGQRKMQKIFVK